MNNDLNDTDMNNQVFTPYSRDHAYTSIPNTYVTEINHKQTILLTIALHFILIIMRNTSTIVILLFLWGCIYLSGVWYRQAITCITISS